MKQSRFLYWFIAIITALAVVVNLPKNYHAKFSFGPIRIDRIINGPDINIHFGPVSFEKKIDTHFGLDLSGGTHLVLEADMKKIPENDRNSAFDAAKNIVERRINLYGLSEPVVQQSKVGNTYRILVELPGVQNVDQAVALIGRTAQLDFREEGSMSAEMKNSTEAAILSIINMKETGLTGKNLRRAQVEFDPNSGRPVVGLEFDEEGAKLFEQITGRNIKKPLGIFLDGEILSYPPPVVQTAISGGRAVISGGFTTEYANQLAISLNSGALPVPIHVVEQRNIGATLGEQTIQRSLFAGIIGLTIVAIFMIVNYGILGVIADIALIIYALIVFALFKIIPITLTLAGIAGFILSIGMAVDANILIFERMKEEMRSGKDRWLALKLGFQRAMPSIYDSNISSLITCTILYWFGSGIVRGFAITLALGIIVSLFSAITVTRTFLRMIYK